MYDIELSTHKVQGVLSSEAFHSLVCSMYKSVATSFASPLLHKRLRSCVSDKDKRSSESKKRMKIQEMLLRRLRP